MTTMDHRRGDLLDHRRGDLLDHRRGDSINRPIIDNLWRIDDPPLRSYIYLQSIGYEYDLASQFVHEHLQIFFGIIFVFLDHIFFLSVIISL